jgi:predicted nucleotidyltransferase
MRPSEAFHQKRQAIRELVPQFRAFNPRVFGSVLRGDDEETSDLDILVDTLPGTTLFDLGGLQEHLRGLLGVQVDIRTPGDLPLTFRDEIVSQAEPV